MNDLKSNIVLYDSRGNVVSSPKEKLTRSNRQYAAGLFGSIFQYPQSNQYRPRYYTLSDTETGLDSLSRECLVRWSREVVSQMPWINSAIRILAQHSVGDAYLPVYMGNNDKWGKIATDWLVNEFYPNCCVRGKQYDFQNVLYLISTLLDTDGDILCIYGKDNYGFPKIQFIPSNRIRSSQNSNKITDGPYKDCIVADGVVYASNGKAIAYVVQNANTLAGIQQTVETDMYVAANNSQLIFDARYFDKSRGIPSVASGILTALSIQELDSYLTERIKIESSIGLIEKTPSGEAPYELQQTLSALENSTTTTYGIAPNVGGIRVVQGSEIRYIKAEGGDIKSLASNTPGLETSQYMKRLEKGICSAIGVPHELIMSSGDVSGRMVSGIVEMFRSTVERRQKILDKHAKFIISYALSVAMANKQIPENYDEPLHKIFNITHPKEFTLDEGYDRRANLEDYNAGIKSLEEIVCRENKTAKQVIDQRGEEAKMFFIKANQIANETGVAVETVIAYLKQDMKVNIRSSVDQNNVDDENKSVNI